MKDRTNNTEGQIPSGRERYLRNFDPNLTPTWTSAEQVQFAYDGSVFSGSNLVRVELDSEGNLVQVRSVSAYEDDGGLHGRESIPFRKTESGGWRGEGGFYGESTVMGRRLNQIVETAQEDWQEWNTERAEGKTHYDYDIWVLRKKGKLGFGHFRR